MAEITKPNEGIAASTQEKKKTSFGTKVMNFMMYGGFIIVLILVMLGIALVSEFMK